MPLAKSYRRLSVSLCGRLADRIAPAFAPLSQQLLYADVKMLLKTWVSMAIFSTLLALFIAVNAVVVLSVLLGLDFFIMVALLAFGPVASAAGVFLAFYLYPVQRASGIRRNIDNDLPFALAHMSAISSAGTPVDFMFQLLKNFSEYGMISRQADKIVRNIKTFGMSSVTAINTVAQQSPSQEFRQVLTGISSTIEKGGDLATYLKEMADAALFDYRIKREKYLKTLSTYADIYTALLVAAPLMMLAVLGIMGIIGGQILGFSINELIVLITWVGLPVLNIFFLAFIHITYPGT